MAVSFFACAGVLLLRAPATGALHHYTDPLRQPVCALLALRFGPEVYRVPYGELLARAEVRRPLQQWPMARYVYPPGALLAFMPPGLLGQWTEIPDAVYRRLCGVWVALLAHLGLWFAAARLRPLPPGWRLAAVVLTWIFVARAALNGQYEPLWLAPAALALEALARQRAGPALGWVALAWATHYRAVVLLPFAAVAVFRLLRARRGYGWVLAFGLTGIVTAVCAWWGLASPFQAEPPLYTRPGDVLLVLDLVGTGLGLVVAWGMARDGVLAATLALIGVLALFDGPHWWHASAVFLPVLTRDVAARWRSPRGTAAGLLVWTLVLEAVWLHRPVALLRDLGQLFRGEPAALAAPRSRSLARSGALPVEGGDRPRSSVG